MLARQGVILPGTNCFHVVYTLKVTYIYLLECLLRHALCTSMPCSLGRYSGHTRLGLLQCPSMHPDARNIWRVLLNICRPIKNLSSQKNRPKIVNHASGMCPKVHRRPRGSLNSRASCEFCTGLCLFPTETQTREHAKAYSDGFVIGTQPIFLVWPS